MPVCNNSQLKTTTLSIFCSVGANEVEFGSVRTNHHGLAVQVVKVNPVEAGSYLDNVEGRAADEQGAIDVQGCPTGDHNLEDDAGQVAASATCVCNSLARDPLMLKCIHCGVEEHASCYRIVEQSEAPAQHCCLSCSGATEDMVCTDPKLLKIAAKKPEMVVSTCTFRRMLVILLTEEFEELNELVNRLGVEPDFADQMFGKLCDDGIVSSANGINFMIYQEKLQRAMGKYFGGKWKGNAAEVNSWQKQGEKAEEENEVTNTAGVENQGHQNQGLSHPGVSGDNTLHEQVHQGEGRRVGSSKQGKSMPMQEKAAKSGH